VPDVSSPFYAAALKGAQGRLEQAGYRVMLMDASLDVDRELAALETLLSHQVDGLLVASTGMPRSMFDGAVGIAATPAIFFDGVVEGTGQGAVTLDNEGGIALLVDHLVEHGHERIGLLAGSQRESAGAARLHAFIAAMAAHGMSPDDRHVKVCAWEIADGRRAALELLADPEPATAVLASARSSHLASCRRRRRVAFACLRTWRSSPSTIRISAICSSLRSQPSRTTRA